jgi:acetyl esterase
MPTDDVTLAGGRFGVRIHRPSGHLDAVVVYLHGGGWTTGSLQTHDRACRRLGARCGVTVAAVDYGLAPEHPAPRDMAPSGFAEATNTDLTASGGSMIDDAHGYGLDIADIEAFNSFWVRSRSAARSEREPSPGERPRGLPDTIVVTCELDPLRDQGEAFARRLADSGVPVRRDANRAWCTTSCSGISYRPRAQPPPTASPTTSVALSGARQSECRRRAMLSAS